MPRTSDCARDLLCSCSQRSQGSAAPLCPPYSSASCYHNCKSSVTQSGQSGVPSALPLALILTPSPNLRVPTCKMLHCKQPLLPERKEAIRLRSITSYARGAVPCAIAQDWASQRGVSGLREPWVLSLAPLDIPALVPGEVLRLKLCCSPEVSMGLPFNAELAAGFTASCLFWAWQHLLPFSAAHASGNIAPAAAT